MYDSRFKIWESQAIVFTLSVLFQFIVGETTCQERFLPLPYQGSSGVYIGGSFEEKGTIAFGSNDFNDMPSYVFRISSDLNVMGGTQLNINFENVLIAGGGSADKDVIVNAVKTEVGFIGSALTVINEDMDLKWSKFFHNDYFFVISSVKIDAGNNFVFVGNGDDPSSGEFGFVGKVDEGGELLWINYIHNQSSRPALANVVLESDIYANGWTEDKGFLTKINLNGDIIWRKLLSVKGAKVRPYSIAKGEGFIYLAGDIERENHNGSNFFVSKITNDGTVAWAKVLSNNTIRFAADKAALKVEGSNVVVSISGLVPFNENDPLVVISLNDLGQIINSVQYSRSSYDIINGNAAINSPSFYGTGTFFNFDTYSENPFIYKVSLKDSLQCCFLPIKLETENISLVVNSSDIIAVEGDLTVSGFPMDIKDVPLEFNEVCKSPYLDFQINTLDYCYKNCISISFEPNEELEDVKWFFPKGTPGTSVESTPPSNICFPAEKGQVVLEVIADGCVQKIKREFSSEKDSVIFPNVFTPNGDGINDSFTPVYKNCEPDYYELKIYDRWGNIAFQSNNISEGWDGKHRNGKPFPSEVFVYSAKIEVGMVKKQYYGDLTLIR